MSAQGTIANLQAPEGAQRLAAGVAAFIGIDWAAAHRGHRAKGASHDAAVRALAFEWIRVQWRCWVDRVPLDESRCLASLQKRGSPILAFAAQNPH